MRRTIVFGVALLALAGCAAGPAPTAGAVVAGPDGSGSACTAERPCTLESALDEAPEGATVELLEGEYDAVTVTEAAASLTVRPAEGADARVGKVDVKAPDITWDGVTFTGGVYLDEGADGAVLRDVLVDGSGVFVHADDVRIEGSTVRDGTSIDGIQVGGANGLVIEDSWVGGFGQGADSDVHSDCVQLFDSSDITLRGNYFGGCDNAALIFSPGGGTGIRSVLVEGNFLQGCVVKDDRCSQGTALDLRDHASDVVVRNNTILDGSVMVEPLPGLVFDRNIVGYASNCAMPMTNTIVLDWNTGRCDQPDGIGADGNRVGEVEVVDREAGDLAPVDPGQVRIEPSGGQSAGSGYGGTPLQDDQAGAGG